MAAIDFHVQSMDGRSMYGRCQTEQKVTEAIEKAPHYCSEFRSEERYFSHDWNFSWNASQSEACLPVAVESKTIILSLDLRLSCAPAYLLHSKLLTRIAGAKTCAIQQ